MEKLECPDVYKNKFLTLLRENCVFLDYGQKSKLSIKEAKSAEFIQFIPNPNNNPYERRIGSLVKSSVRLNNYSKYILIDKLYDTKEVDSFSFLLDRAINILVYHAKKEIEKEVINMFLHNRYLEKQNNSLFTNKSLKDLILLGVNTLIEREVPPFQNGYYTCFIHPKKLEELIMSQHLSLLPAEEGRKKCYVDFFGVKYIPSPLLVKYSENEEIYQTLIIGSNAYGIVDLDENSANIVCKDINQGTVIGYEINFAMDIIDTQAIVKIESS
jgi:hypothetical protein